MEYPDKEKLLREEFLRVAQVLFQKYGFEKTTMEDIARDARKSKTTLYQCFKNKNKLLESLINYEMREVFSMVITEVNKYQSASERIKVYMKTTFLEVRKKIFLYALLKGEMASSLVDLYNLKNDVDALEIDEIKGILRDGIIMGEFASNHMRNIEVIAYYLVNGARGMLIQLVMDPNPDQDILNEDCVDTVMDLFIKGLRS